MKKRFSNLELLRIVAMTFIVMAHMMFHGVLYEPVASSAGITHTVTQWITLGGKLGVGLFIMITGYFNVKKSSWNISGLLKLWFQTFFYSVGIFIIFFVFKLSTAGQIFSFKPFVPLLANQYWFVTDYFIVMILAPVLNLALTRLKARVIYILFAVSFILLFLVPTLSEFQINFFGHPQFVYLIFMYAVGGMIQLHRSRWMNNVSLIWTILLVTLIVYTVQVVRYNQLAIIHPSKALNYFDIVSNYGSVTSVLNAIIALMVFLLFVNWNVAYNPKINSIASAAFGVYLLSDNNYVRWWLWQSVLNLRTFVNQSVLSILALMIVVVPLVYAIGFLVDKVRQSTFEKLTNKLITRFITPFIRKYGRGLFR